MRKRYVNINELTHLVGVFAVAGDGGSVFHTGHLGGIRLDGVGEKEEEEEEGQEEPCPCRGILEISDIPHDFSTDPPMANYSLILTCAFSSLSFRLLILRPTLCSFSSCVYHPLRFALLSAVSVPWKC